MSERLRVTRDRFNQELLPSLPDSIDILQKLVEARASRLDRPRIPVDQVLIARPLGYCAGVVMATEAMEEMLRRSEGQNLHSHHYIVHNEDVVDYFRRKDVVFADSIDDIPEGVPIISSAHGASPDVVRKAKEKASQFVDAVCPLVEKVHSEVRRIIRQGLKVVLIGHQGHDETIGVVGEDPENVLLVESIEDVQELAKRVDRDEIGGILTQTTLAQGEWEPIAEVARAQWPEAWVPKESDVCYATQNRQDGLKEVIVAGAKKILVVTSQTSSNGMALVRVAMSRGAEAYQVATPYEVPETLQGSVVGITAAASTPGSQILGVLAVLAPQNGMVNIGNGKEEEKFQLPGELRRAQRELNK